MKVADYVVQVLSANGVKVVFGHLGGFNADIVDSIYNIEAQNFVLGYHEQASSFAANSYAILTENVSVAVASGAPSACNLVAGIANAYFDSNACLFLVGSVHSKAVRTSKTIRQNAFEEIDFVSVVDEITKYAAKVTSPFDVRYYLEKALFIAQEGRKGPVVLDIPYDVARTDIAPEDLQGFEPPVLKANDIVTEIKQVLELLNSSEKPLILLGGGATSKKCREELSTLLDKVKVPVVSSLCGIDVLPHDHPCYFGFIGHYGNRYANFAVANCDCLIVLGSRLDERQIAGDINRFAPDAYVIKVDIDHTELKRVLPETVSIHATVEEFLEQLCEEKFVGCDFSRWHSTLSTWQERYPSYTFSSPSLTPNTFFHLISDYLPRDAIICSDVGQTQMCVAQALRLDGERRLLNSAGYGSMGYSLPAAIGAAYASKDKLIVSVNGDGGIQMNIQELQTVKRDKLPIAIIVVNNNCLGMIRRLQERIYDNRTVASVKGYSVPDYGAIAEGFGLEYTKIDSLEQVESIKELFNSRLPQLIEIVVEQNMENVPEPGASIDMQTPLLSDEENQLIKKESNFCNM